MRWDHKFSNVSVLGVDKKTRLHHYSLCNSFGGNCILFLRVSQWGCGEKCSKTHFWTHTPNLPIKIASVFIEQSSVWRYEMTKEEHSTHSKQRTNRKRILVLHLGHSHGAARTIGSLQDRSADMGPPRRFSHWLVLRRGRRTIFHRIHLILNPSAKGSAYRTLQIEIWINKKAHWYRLSGSACCFSCTRWVCFVSTGVQTQEENRNFQTGKTARVHLYLTIEKGNIIDVFPFSNVFLLTCTRLKRLGTAD